MENERMSYEEALAYIHGAQRFKGTKLLERMEFLLSLLGNPHKQLKFVHIAGTNGKGSIAHMISKSLTESGYKTGLFISPYVVDFRERIQIDGELISKEELAEIASEVKAADLKARESGLYVTEFQIVTLCGLLYFCRKGCDIAVLEVGLGGRLDATNVISGYECAAIAHIDYDHTHILGNTLEEITHEKCGILKGGELSLYPVQAEETFRTAEAECLRTRCV